MSSRIVCMVRGGEAGRQVQRQAIAYAQKTGLPLVFLHIINLRGLAQEEVLDLAPALEELTWLARVTLSLARRRAHAAGLQADTAIRIGPFLDATVAFLKEGPVDHLFLGSPSLGISPIEGNTQRVREFAEQISKATGVPVMVVD